jgi:hypothetical protein
VSAEIVEIGAEWLDESPSSYKFYGGTETLYFDPKEHRYYRYDALGNDVTISGVTSAVHIIDKSAALTQWAANMACEYLREQWAALQDPVLNVDGQVLTEELIEKWLSAAKFAHRDYKDKAAETGKFAHDWVEQYIKALIVTNHVTDSPQVTKLLNEKPEDPRALSGVNAALDWMERHKVRWVFTERKVYSKLYDFAGTLDGLAYVTACGDADCCGQYVTLPDVGYTLVPATFVDELMVIDWKTSNRLYPEYHYQTAAYRHALLEELGAEFYTAYRIIIRLGKEDAEFESRLLPPEDLEMDFRTFIECLALYKTIETAKCAEREHKTRIKEAKAAAKDREEAEVKARRVMRKSLVKQAREEAKALYKSWRNARMSVAESTLQANTWLTDTLKQIEAEWGKTPADEDDVELEEAA